MPTSRGARVDLPLPVLQSAPIPEVIFKSEDLSAVSAALINLQAAQ